MEEILTYELKVQLAIGGIVTFLSLFLIFFLVTILVKTIKLYKKKRNLRFTRKLESRMGQLLALEDSASRSQIDQAIQQIRSTAERGWQKDLLAATLVHYKRNLSGFANALVTEVYFMTLLHHRQMRQLKKGSVTQKITAMRYLAAMRHHPAWYETIQYINDERRLLRIEASMALVLLTENPLFILDKLQRPLTNWQKINLYKQLKQLKKERIPDFARWLNSPNPTVVVFALEMISRFNQYNAIEAVGALLTNAPVMIQTAAVRTLTDLEASQYTPLMMDLLDVTDEGDHPLKKALIVALGKMSTESSHAQSIARYLHDSDFEIRFEAARAIQYIEGNESEFLTVFARHSEQSSLITQHLYHPLLN